MEKKIKQKNNSFPDLETQTEMRFQIDFDYDINVDITSRTNIYEAPNFESFLRIASHKPEGQNISFFLIFLVLFTFLALVSKREFDRNCK